MSILTPRLCLRPWTHTDAPAFTTLQAENTDHLRTYMSWSDRTYTLDDAEERIATALYYEREGTHRYRGVFDRDSGLPIGEVSVHVRTGIARRGEPPSMLGYWLGKESEGKGLMREALTAFLSTLSIPTAYAMIDGDNHRSIALVNSLGFSGDGRLDQFRLFKKDLSR